MTPKHLALTLLLTTAAAAQQSMPDMPGMPMPQQSAPKPKVSPNPPDPKPTDLSTANPRAKAAARSQQDSVHQQAAQPQTKPDDHADGQSITIPTQLLQEPEALDLRTGANLPAPELLADITPREPLSVESFLILADRSNPTLVQAQRNIDRSVAQARQAGLPPDPTLGYSAEHIRGGSYNGGEQGAFFSQTFVLGRKLALRRDIFRAEGRSNQIALEIQQARIRNDVASAFIDTLATQTSVALHDRLLQVALDTAANTHELARIGQADASDILTSEIAAEQAKIDFTDSQRMFLAHFARLATLSGQSSMPPHPLTGPLTTPPDLDPETLVTRDAAETPERKRAEANVSVAEARLRSAKREPVPNLTVKAGEWYSGETLGATNKEAGWMSFAEAGINLPLWNRNQGNVAAAEAELDRARHDVVRTELLTRNRAEPLAQQYLAARFTAERYRTEMLPRARRAFQLQAMKYQQMAQPYPAVLTAQHLLYTLQVSYVQALQQQWHAAIALGNFTLTDALDQPMSTGDDTTTRNLPTCTTE